jgi:hypothetical protein
MVLQFPQERGPLIGGIQYGHLDSRKGDEALLSPREGLWHDNAFCPSTLKPYVGESQAGSSLQKLIPTPHMGLETVALTSGASWSS